MFACDFHFLTAESVYDEEAAVLYGYNALSLGIDPGSLFFSFIEGMHTGVTSQIGVKMALDSFTEASLSSHPLLEASRKEDGAAAREIIKNGFRAANSAVYDYAAKMLSGGRITVMAVAAAFDGQSFSIGRTGEYESYLWRSGKLSRFHGGSGAPVQAAETLERLIGANKKIRVDLATVRTELDDLIVVTTFPASAEAETCVLEHVSRDVSCEDIARGIMETARRRMRSAARAIGVAAARIESAPIVLEDIVME